MGLLLVILGVVLFSLAEAGLTIVMYQKLGLSWTFGILLISILVSGGLEYISRRRWEEKQKHSNPELTVEIIEEALQSLLFIVIFIFLIFPGMLTDVVGVLLLIPMIRDSIVHSIALSMLKDSEQNPKLLTPFLERNKRKKGLVINQ